MGCWGDTIDDLKTAIAGADAFQSFIGEWDGPAGSVADHVFLHDWPEPTFVSDRYEVEELEAKYRAFALVRVVPDGGLVIQKALATRTAFIRGQLEIEFARLVPHNIRADMSAVLQQAITATGPIAREIMDGTEGLWQTMESDGFPWRTAEEDRLTLGDFHGMTYLLNWGHPQGGA